MKWLDPNFLLHAASVVALLFIVAFLLKSIVLWLLLVSSLLRTWQR